MPNLIFYKCCQRTFDMISRQLTLIDEIKAHTKIKFGELKCVKFQQ